MKRREEIWNGIFSNVSCPAGELRDEEHVMSYIDGIDINTKLYV